MDLSDSEIYKRRHKRLRFEFESVDAAELCQKLIAETFTVSTDQDFDTGHYLVFVDFSALVGKYPIGVR